MTKEIPSALIRQWEREAIAQELPYTEFGNFLKMKERLYWQSVEEKKERPQIFANDARNKLTEYGQRVALKALLSIPEIERACKFARFDLEELKEKLSRGFESDAQRENFLWARSHWFARLKDRMRELRISKETLASYGVDWKECKRFAFQVI